MTTDQIAVLVPPPEAYKYRNDPSKHPMTKKEFEEKGKLFGGRAIGVEYPLEGGMHILREGMKYPTKGIPYPAAIQAIAVVKSMLVVWLFSFNPFVWKKAFKKFIETSHQVLAPHMLQDRFLTKTAKEIGEIVYKFFKTLNLEEHNLQMLKEIAIHVIEYDDAYRLISQDLLRETTGYDLSIRPLRETNRLIKLLISRLPPNEPRVYAKYHALKWVLRALLCLPRIRIAFKNAFRALNWHVFKFDKADEYYAATKHYYNFWGMNREARWKLFLNLHGATGSK